MARKCTGEKRKMQKTLVEIARFILYFMTMVVVTTAVFFIFGMEISYYNVLLPMIIIIMYYVLKQDISWRNKLLIISISIIAIIIASSFSANLYDFTWDGNAYHKQAVGLLKEGWNPIYYASSNFNSLTQSSQLASDGPLFWSEVYPKASWYFAASIYYVAGNIEAGKCYTILFAMITFGFCYDFFSRILEKKYAPIVLALITAANPVVCAQIQSYYLDGLVSAVLSLMIITFIDEINTDGVINHKGEIICLIIWGCNLKFSVILYVVTFCAVFIIYRTILLKRIDWKNSVLLGGTGVFAAFIVGCSPYLTNLKRYGDMFYGFFGIVDEQQMSKEFGVESLSRTGRFFASIFGKMSHGSITSLHELLKVPFTVHKQEFDMYCIVDPRVGGFGVFFSGLFLISIVVIIVRVIKDKKEGLSHQFKLVLLLFAANFVEMMFLPQTSQVRYIPQLYLVIVFAMTVLCKITVTGKIKLLRNALNIFMVCIVCLNILPWMFIIAERTNEGVITTTTLKNMSRECGEGRIFEVSYYCDDFNGLDYNLKDFDIKYRYIKNVKVDETYSSICGNMLRFR